MIKFDQMLSLNYISLYESIKRRLNLVSDAEKYGIIKINHHVAEPFLIEKTNLKVIGSYVETLGNAGIGVNISHLRSIKYWYDNTDEQYALFAEDDLDLSICEYWNFTMTEFVNKLPSNWEAVQLVRIKNFSLGYDGSEGLCFRYRNWDDWGCAGFLLTRNYAKKIIDRHIFNDVYDLTINGIQPIVENVLFYGLGVVYNFPLFIEKMPIGDNIDVRDKERGIDPDHMISSDFYKNLWKQNNLSIEEIIGK